MGLSRRQRKLYIYRITSYKPIPDQDGFRDQTFGDLVYDPQPVLVLHPAYLQGRSDITVAGPQGRTTADIIFTQDVWHLCDTDEEDNPIAIDINHVFRLEAVYRADGTAWAHPEIGTWYHVLGEPTFRPYKARKVSVYAKKMDLPPLGLQ